jgi:hypothetical protein
MTVVTSIARTVALVVIAILNFTLSSAAAQIIKKYISATYEGAKSGLQNASRFVLTLLFVFLANALVRAVMNRVVSGRIAGVDLGSIGERNGTPATGFAYVMFLGNDLKTFLPLISFA